MRIEIILFLIAAAIIANIYTEGKLLKKAFTFKKYYQMAGIALGALFLYYILKKNPLNAKNILAVSNDLNKTFLMVTIVMVTIVIVTIVIVTICMQVGLIRPTL